MSDRFNIVGSDNILGSELETPPTFQEAVGAAVDRLQQVSFRFEELYIQVPEEGYTEEEWRAVEAAAHDALEAVEHAEEGYVAVQFDSHAWYRIVESIDKVRLRLESAIGIIERVRERPGPAPRH